MSNMKKLVFILFLLSFSNLIIAQFAVNSPNSYLILTDATYNLDALILINGIDENTTVKYTGTGNAEWRYIAGGSWYNSNQNSIIPEDGVLYNVDIDGQKKYNVFVIDYSLYKPKYTSLEIIEEPDVICERIYLHPQVDISDLKYQDRNGNWHVLPRSFKLSYTTVKWTETEELWVDNDTIINVVLPIDKIPVPAPLKNTYYVLKGDNYAEQMGIVMDSVVSDEYQAVAVKAHPNGIVVERGGLNEIDRKDDKELRGSAPLVIDFASRANPINGIFYEWFIWNVKEPSNQLRYTDKDMRYTFEDTGEYWVKLIASTASCQYVDSLAVKSLESMLQVPNVFTPNGDGLNDEFRVAFRSLKNYNIVIKNRWGRTVYKSNDPSKGWNGKIGGAQAAEGTYYYVIIAEGTDLDIEGKPVKYRTSGDINLLR